jgi:hypothetical protein
MFIVAYRFPPRQKKKGEIMMSTAAEMKETDKVINIIVGRNIKAERVRRGLTQKDMAQKIGISTFSISLSWCSRTGTDSGNDKTGYGVLLYIFGDIRSLEGHLHLSFGCWRGYVIHTLTHTLKALIHT